MNYTIEKAKEENRTDIFRLLKQVNMHYIPSEEMPRLTYENYFVAKNDGDQKAGAAYLKDLGENVINHFLAHWGLKTEKK